MVGDKGGGRNRGEIRKNGGVGWFQTRTEARQRTKELRDLVGESY